MNRIWLFLCFLCIPWAARGQSAYEWNCWFDDDTMLRQSGIATGDVLSIDILTSELAEGFHAFHVQVADTAGRFSPPQTRLFYHVGDNSISKLRYWFDEDEDRIYTTNAQGGQNTIDVSPLQPGIHIVYCQIEYAVGKLSDVFSGLFYRQIDTDLLEWSYWFDEDENSKRMTSHAGETVLIDVSELADGFHTIHHQVRGLASSDVVTRMFIKVPQTENVPDMTCICTVDNKLVSQSKVPGHGGVISWEMDVSSLNVGLHRAQFQVITPAGVASTIAERYFVRVISDNELGRMKCIYSLDNTETHSVQGTASNGLFHLDLDVSALEDGLHRMSYMMVADDGTTTPQQTAFFWKTPLGGEGIVQYDYWMNDDEEHVHKFKLEKRENPFKLISLLPVETYPVRSSCFHFEVKDDQPMLYAKNDFHIRFYDTSAREVNETKQYVDYQIKQEVETVGELQTTQTFPKVSENDIRWYTMHSAPGDTAAFRLSQAATLQVFAPSGKEVFNTSQSASVKWGGIHTWEDGTYYVAVHGITGSQSNITLNYMHMDKYDVVDWDVHTVGNGGCSTITFKGNGFRDLYAVDLFNAQGDTIKHVYIGHESDAMISVVFDFSDASMGKYNALFYFTEEKKVFTGLVTVEEAKDIELATTVTFTSSYTVGSFTKYSVRITNKGNMTAYDVPVFTWLKSKTRNGISYIKYEGLNLSGLFEGIDIDSLTIKDITSLKYYSILAGDDHHFMKFIVDDDECPGDSAFIRSNYFFTNIAPYETKTLHLMIQVNEPEVKAYFTIPDDWQKYSVTQNAESSRRIKAHFKSSEQKSRYCCMADNIDCVLNTASFWLDMASAATMFFPSAPSLIINGLDCGASVLSAVNKTAKAIACGADGAADDMNGLVGSAAKSMVSAGVSCVAARFSKLGGLKYLKDASRYGNIGNGLSALVAYVDMGNKTDGDFSCFKNWSKHIPGCPLIPPRGGTSFRIRSMDPNDILGYLAESGSKTIKDGMRDVFYTIQFENDKVLATAPAHDIYLTDTLDENLFDLSTYQPMRIKIGEKSAELTGDKNFVTTVDMRPEINAIAQVEGTYDQQNGIVRWHITSLDPMTMEPTDDLMDGVLPVNTNGNGIGEVSYNISLKPNLTHGMEINNHAGIVFDHNEVIITPTWTNVIDRITPESHVTDVQILNDSTATVSISATDELSGAWRYDVYVQYGEGSAWWKAAENVPVDTMASVKIYEGINHGFYVVATDSAGNVEQKQAAREFTLDVFGTIEETNTEIELAQGWNWISHNQHSPLSVDALKPVSTRMVGQTEELIDDARFGWTGDLEELLPTQMYKIQVNNPQNIQLSGRLFTSLYQSVPLYQGWNWIGYPMANTMTPAEALAKLEAEEGDMLIGQDGLTAFSDGQWIGTLVEMVPGQGYMYRSASDKNLFYNATAQASARRIKSQTSMLNTQIPEGWTVDKRKYPNVMGVIAVLMQNNAAVDVNDWIVGAFCNDECRGISSDINGTLMMNVYGQGGEPIVFYAVNCETGEMLPIAETELFEANVLGSIQQPYSLHIGETTGISGNMRELMNASESLYDLHGRKVEGTQLKKGIYVTTDKNHSKTQKVIRR